METEFPVFSQMYGAPDAERAEALAVQASLPSDFVDPADAVGDAEWRGLVDADIAEMGEGALADFRTRWDWEMTPAQRAAALADVAFRREADALVDDASSFAAKPPVDPQEYAAQTLERRAERARRI